MMILKSVVGIWTMTLGLTSLWRMSRKNDKRLFYFFVCWLCASGAALVIITRA